MAGMKKAADPGGGKRPRKRNGRRLLAHYRATAWLSIGAVCRRYAVSAEVIIGWTECRFFPPPTWFAQKPYWDPVHLDLHDSLVYRGGGQPSPEKAAFFDVLYWRASG